MIRSLIAGILYFFGVLHLLLYLRLRKRAIVLMYHRVVSKANRDKIFSHPGIVIETETFGKHLQFLRQYFHVITAHQFWEQMSSGQAFQNRTCLITFDDGWQDNYTEAFPLLEKYALPAVIFLPVGFIGTGKKFWQETLTHVLWKILEIKGETHESDSHHAKVFAKLGLNLNNLKPDKPSKALIQDRISQLKPLPESELNNFLNDIKKIIDNHSTNFDHHDTFLGWEQIQNMSMGLIQFGSHSVNHKILTKIPLEEVQEEVATSKKILEHRLDNKIIAFSYPNGGYNEQISKIVRENGYQLAFCTQEGLVKSNDDPYTIKRINIHQGSTSSTPLFLARIVGIL